jgi:hypothetical protein
MPLTARELNRATLARQLLLERARLGVPAALERIFVLQAQEPASPYLALWARLRDFDPAGLDAAFADATVLKAPLVRLTLHAVLAGDYPALHNAMAPSLRASRVYDRRYTTSGLAEEDADAAVPKLLDFAAEPRAKADMEAHLAGFGDGAQRMWWALRTFAPLVRVPGNGPWSFDARSPYVTASERLAPDERQASVRHLVRRYLQAFGPASVVDLAQFSMLGRPLLRAALGELDEVERLEGPDGTGLFDLAGLPRPDGDTPAPPRLLPMWDSTLLAYADRGRVIPPDFRKLVTRNNGDVLPTLLVDGYVAGVWRPVGGRIEATAFAPLPEKAWAGLQAEATALLAFLADRDPAVYRRYGHWWAKLPDGEVRLLGG